MGMMVSKLESLFTSNATCEKVGKVISEMNERFKLRDPCGVFRIPAADATENRKVHY
jgi:hypothetical protein